MNSLNTLNSVNGCSCLDVDVSCYPDYYSTVPKTIKLLNFLNSQEHASKVQMIRSIEDKKLRDKEKAKLPAITPSGIFSNRKAELLLTHSGLIQFDIDFKENDHISNYESIKQHLTCIPQVAYCALSVSGKGYWGLVPIDRPEQHLGHFLALQDAFKRLGIIIDPSCKDASRLRGYSYDTDAYFNHNAKKLLFTAGSQKHNRHVQTRFIKTDSGKATQKCLEQIEKRRVDITVGYDSWFNCSQ